MDFNMSKTLVYTTRSYKGKEGQLIAKHFRAFSNSFDLITDNKTQKSVDLLSSMTGASITKWFNLEDDYQSRKHMASWADVYESIDVTSFSGYDKICLIGGLYIPNSLMARGSKRCGVFPNDSAQLRFISTGTKLYNILVLVKISRTYDVPIHELAFEPDAMTLDLLHVDYRPTKHYAYHGYDIPLYNIHRLDSLQYNVNDSFFDDVAKTIDFTFGYTSVGKTSRRSKYLKEMQSICVNFEKHNLFVQDDATGLDTRVSPDVYMNYIEKSKYTFMLPSYDEHCFSPYRFIESLMVDCLPLIHVDCNLTDIQKSFDVDMTMLIRTTPFEEEERIMVLSYMKSKFLVVERKLI
jgi:hypothetical protein